jgi:hypothetical protein
MAIPDDVLTELKPEPLEDAARKVRSGDLLLCSAHDPFSKLISWATKSPWSHVAIAWRWPSLGEIMVFESVQKLGVRAVPLSKFIRQTSTGETPYPGKILLARHEKFRDAVRAEDGKAKQRFVDFAVDQLGDPFSPGEIAKIAARISFARTGRKAPKSLGPANEMICSEYVARCFHKIGLDIPWDGRGFIAPAQVALTPEVHAVTQIRTR